MIRIERTYMLHSGGTKFYQPFRVTKLEGRGGTLVREAAVTLIHFGPVSSSGAGFSGRPILGGQVQMSGSATHYDTQIALKAKGDSKGAYRVEKRGSIDHDIEDARAELTTLFGATTAENIMLSLGLRADGSETSPIPDPETKDSAASALPTAEKPAHWGQW